MRIESISKYSRIFFLPFFLMVMFSSTIFAQTSELSLVDIFTALRSKKATLIEKNQILAAGVKQRGITFSLSKTLQEELQNAGADENLIEAIREKSPTKISIEKTKVEPTPQPANTPRPGDFSYYQNRGNSKYVIGEYASAIKDYTEAIKLNEKESTLFFSRGLAYSNEKQYLSAIADFDKVIELDPSESMAYFHRGNSMKEVGKFEDALENYKKATELDAENEPAKTAFQQLRSDLNIKPNSPQTVANNKNAEPIEVAPDDETTATNSVINIGSLESLVKNLYSPNYPALERQLRTEGVVTVQVVIDEDGKVTSANAVSGPSGLRSPSEIAAKRSKFKPYKINNVAVKVTGYINYNFKRD